MSGFHDVRFPVQLALGSQGGPEHRTDIITLANGREIRNARWSGSRRRWDIGSAITSLADLHEILAFFEARKGALHGFRFRDPMDYASGLADQPPRPDDQFLGEGDGQTNQFQLIKTYGGFQRSITRPVAETVRIAADENELEQGWQVDPSCGRIVFSTPPAPGVRLTAGFIFDCAVRFESDQLKAVMEAFGAGRVVSLGLIELFDEGNMQDA